MHAFGCCRLGDRISAFRRLRGMTQRELADRIGVSPGFVSKLERGVKEPAPDTVRKICTVLGVSSDWLLLEERIGQGELAGLLRLADLPRQCRLAQIKWRLAAMDRHRAMVDSLLDELGYGGCAWCCDAPSKLFALLDLYDRLQARDAAGTAPPRTGVPR